MRRLIETLVCEVGEQKIALSLEHVERVLPAMALTPVPGAPAREPGVINLHGETRPLYVLRAFLGEPARAMEPDDQIVLARAGPRAVALLVDQACGVHPGADRTARWIGDLESFLAGARPAAEGTP